MAVLRCDSHFWPNFRWKKARTALDDRLALHFASSIVSPRLHHAQRLCSVLLGRLASRATMYSVRRPRTSVLIPYAVRVAVRACMLSFDGKSEELASLRVKCLFGFLLRLRCSRSPCHREYFVHSPNLARTQYIFDANDLFTWTRVSGRQLRCLWVCVCVVCAFFSV